MSCWRYTPSPKQEPLPRLLGSYLSRLSAHNLSKIKYLISLFQHTSTVECRSCVVYAQNNNLCQFGLLSQAYQPISPSILIHYRWELYQVYITNLENGLQKDGTKLYDEEGPNEKTCCEK